MAWSLIASAFNGTGANGTTTSNIDTTGADLLVCGVGDYQVTNNPTITDSKSNTWTKLTIRTSGSSVEVTLFYATNVSGKVGSGHNFTAGTSNSYPGLTVLAFSGAHLTAPFDDDSGTGASSGTSIQPGSLTPAGGATTSLFVTAVGFDATNTVAIDSSFNTPVQQQYSGGAFFGCGISWLAPGTSSSKNPTWSWGSSTDNAAAMAIFKAAAGGGPAFYPSPTKPIYQAVKRASYY